VNLESPVARFEGSCLSDKVENWNEELAPGCPQHLQSSWADRPQGHASSSTALIAPPEQGE
jgi:hypothetical protein